MNKRDEYKMDLFPTAVLGIIADYAKENVLLPWIDEKILCNSRLSANSAAMDFLLKNLDRVELNSLCGNNDPRAIDLAVRLCKSPDFSHLNWIKLSSNPSALRLLKQNPEHVFPELLAAVPHDEAIDFLAELCPVRAAQFINLSGNPCPKAIEILSQNIDYVNKRLISGNPSAMPILFRHPDKINWFNLCENPAAADLILENLDKVHWGPLSSNTNPKITRLFRANLHRLNWKNLSMNPSSDAVAILGENLNMVWLEYLCTNTNPDAINIVRILQRSYDIGWTALSANPAIFYSNRNEIYEVLCR